MARQKPEENVNETEATEAPVEAQTDAATAPTEAAAPAETEAAAAPAEVDLGNFQSAVQAAVAGASAAGDITPELQEDVVNAYRELEGQKGKNAGQKYLREQVGEYVKALDMQKAKVIVTLDEAVKAGGGKKAAADKEPAKPVDPTEAYLVQRLTLDLARGHLQVPEGVAADVEDQVNTRYTALAPQFQTQLAWVQGDKETRGDEPEDIDPIVKASVKLLTSSTKTKKSSSGGGGGTRAPFTGTRRNIKKHIEQVFADQPSGTFLKVAAIAKASSEEYGDDHPSQGAVSASLDSAKFDVPGVTPATEDGAKGARKN